MYEAANFADDLKNAEAYGFEVKYKFDWQKLKAKREAHIAKVNQRHAEKLEKENLPTLFGRA